MSLAKAYAAHSTTAPLVPFTFERRAVAAGDVRIEILYSGICHSDLHQARDDWGGAKYPMVPGHEIIGKVVEVGAEVTKLKVGDFAGVGCMVDSCRHCEACNADLEQYCAEGSTFTYNGTDRHTGEPTQGGYSDHIVVEQRFVVKVSETLDLKAAAPLLCAGITTYSPLKHFKVGPGQKVGVIGLGGLGHMGVKFAKALGAHVVMITTTPEKGADATRLGADEVLVSRDPEQMKAHAGSFDFLLNTIPVGHDTNPYMGLLKRDATMCLVGVLTELDPPLTGVSVIFGRKHLTGSAIGGMAETQEMMDFCAEHGIVSDVEVINIQDVNEAWERMAKNDVRYRFVIDMASIKG
ncbi:hydroxyacid dehydrogenase [Stenotrophomonas chelatiphaga]|uniref:Hydroxyacid dehydrogenase n=1 Tax=Stenotrophomonas chelatiphaga TaxID=517011 RepID=A0A0R0CVA5_9GAMM|nr:MULTISPECIES: NAD(P)-dependent alcohol dehydrogenase [Stenotrophomonas]KRG73679.1 hydroxyacid dehydrogenase [Stenotrophomonas chelatiphaga]MCS4230020.1 putative zinc-type alcohol dehydrogenase-like protein [Stenotrophomonas chelatiphaga]MDR6093336.1 putative zinc-type alcohol dehydrogenase-like protein [Stenotrophomonas sp. SORGH_AS_0321]ROQ45757.1 putative zinc-type alcohol dehydrogenase-like protein [Stenotrophomonas maltophilia]